MTRVVKVSELENLTRRLAIAKVLEARDKVGKQAKSDAQTAIGTFKQQAPYKTGSMGSSISIGDTNKSNAKIMFRDGKNAIKAYSTNKRGIRKGWLDKWKRTTGTSFISRF